MRHLIIALAALLTPALASAQGVPVHGKVQEHVLGALFWIAAGIGVVALALIAVALRRGRAGLVALALLLPTVASAQVPKHGVGWTAKPGSTVVYAFGLGAGSPCPRGSQRGLQPQHDPWALAGDAEARRAGTPWTAAGLTPAQRAASRRAYGLLFGSRPTELDAGQECWQGGLGGGAPHGVGDAKALRDWYEIQSPAHRAAWDGVPNEREQEHLQSQGEWCRLLSLIGRDCRPASGWSSVALADLDPEFWVGADNLSPSGVLRKVRAYAWPGAAPSGSCTYWNATSAYMAVRPPSEAPECWEQMQPSCQTVASLRLACWDVEPLPVCGDGTCDPGEDSTSCPADCPVPPPSAPDIRVLGCSAGSWEVVIDGVTSIVQAPAEVSVDGVTVALPLCPTGGECPEAAILGRVRAEVCQ